MGIRQLGQDDGDHRQCQCDLYGNVEVVADTATPPENPTDPVVPAEPTPQEVTPGKDPGSVKPVKEASLQNGR